MNEASVKEVERDSHVFIPGAFEALDWQKDLMSVSTMF
jgi:hypothetical protein